MADITTKNQLKQWFVTTAKPTQAQYYAWMDSYWHKSESIPQSSIDGLAVALGNKAEAEQFQYYAKADATNIDAIKWRNVLGVGEVDLTNYYTKTQVDNLISNVTVDLTSYHTITQYQTWVNNALAAKENTIAAGTATQYYRGDKTWQTLNKTAVGLGNIDNTSDANKPVSTAQSTALGLKVDKVTGQTGKFVKFKADGNIEAVMLNSTMISKVLGYDTADQPTSANTVPISALSSTTVALTEVELNASGTREVECPNLNGYYKLIGLKWFFITGTAV